MTVALEHYATGGQIARAIASETEELGYMLRELAEYADDDWIADISEHLHLDDAATERAVLALQNLFAVLAPEGTT